MKFPIKNCWVNSKEIMRRENSGSNSREISGEILGIMQEVILGEISKTFVGDILNNFRGKFMGRNLWENDSRNSRKIQEEDFRGKF